jgi:hypothetical protein
MGYMVTNGLMDLTVVYMIWFMLDGGQTYVIEDRNTGLLYPVLNNLTTGSDDITEEESEL